MLALLFGTIRHEAIADHNAIYELHQKAFGGDGEANLVDALRDGGFVEVSLVAESNGQVVGHILFSRVSIITNDTVLAALSLAPMAVAPLHQQTGIGSILVKEGLYACRKSGHRIVLVLGHPEFYARFGFSSALAQPIESPFGGGEVWMALELVDDALKHVHGRVEFSPPFAAVGGKGEVR